MVLSAKVSQHGSAVLAVAVAAIMSGFVGIFSRYLSEDKDVPSFDVAVLLLFFATLALFLLLLFTDRNALKVKKKDLPMFAIFGITVFLSYGTLFYAQEEVALSLATLLQMTAPYYVMLVSLFLFREKITAQKLAAMMVTMLGCIMVTGIIYGRLDASMGGVVSALLSGLFDGMFAVGARVGYDRGYGTKTILFYILFFALLSSAVYSMVTSDLPEEFAKLSDPYALGSALLLGAVLTLVPFYLMTYGSSLISASLVSMIAVLELVSTSLVGYVFFDESITAINILGMALIGASIVLADVKLCKKVREYREESGRTEGN